MEKRIIYTDANNNVNVIVPSIHWMGTLEELAIKDVPDGLSWRITDVSNIPVDRTYRNAWTDENPAETVDVDIVKAKNIQKECIRKARKPLLELLDIEYQRADELGDVDMKQEIVAKKENLRNFTTRVDNVTNLTSLKEILPNDASL